MSKHRTAIFAEGHTYLSYCEAEECLHITRRAIRQRVQSKQYSLATEEQIKVEKERRSREGTGPIKLNQGVSRARSGRGQAVIVNGVRYSSISEAARANNISVQAMSRRLQRGTEGHFYADD